MNCYMRPSHRVAHKSKTYEGDLSLLKKTSLVQAHGYHGSGRPSQQPRLRARELEQRFHIIFIGVECV